MNSSHPSSLLLPLTAFARSVVRLPALLRVARRAGVAALGMLVWLAALPLRAQTITTQ